MHLLRNPAQAGLKPSLPCVKGGGTACRDGGIVKSDNLHKTIPQSASLTAPFTQGSLSHIRTSCAYFSFAICSSAEHFLNPATMVGFSLYNKKMTKVKNLPLSFFVCLCPNAEALGQGDSVQGSSADERGPYERTVSEETAIEFYSPMPEYRSPSYALRTTPCCSARAVAIASVAGASSCFVRVLS